MKTLVQRMNTQAGVLNESLEENIGKYFIYDVRKDMNYYETLCLILSELDIDTSDVTQDDFDACEETLELSCKALNPDTGFNLIVWFD